MKNKRIYFLLYKEICIILLVSALDKGSQQQETIDNIKMYLSEYKEFAYQFYDNLNR